MIRSIFVVFAAALFLLAQPVAASIIDDFNDGFFDISRTSPGSVSSTDTGSMIGGYRNTTLQWDAGTGGYKVDSSVCALPSSVLIWEEGDSIKGKLTILYNANGAGLGGGAGVDVTDGGPSSQWLFACPVGGGDGSTFDVTITAKDASAATETWTGTFAGYGTFALPFSGGSGSIDLNHVTSIQYLFDSAKGGVVVGNGGGDYTFDLLGTTPEPATLSMLALGGLLVIRRRRSK